MNFKDEHIPILEQHKHHWTGFRDIGVMKNLDTSVLNDLQLIYNEAVGPEKFQVWCKDCVCEMIRLLYVNFERWQEHRPAIIPDGVEPIVKKSGKKRTPKAEL